MKSFSQKIIVVMLGLALLSLPTVAFADESATTRTGIKESFDINVLQPNSTDQKPLYIQRAQGSSNDSGNTINVPPIFILIRDAVDFLSALIASVALLVFIVGSLLMILSEGQEDRLQKGKQAMIYAIIGLIIALMAYVITNAVQSVFF